MLTLCIKHIPNVNQDFGIDTEVLHSGIVPKPKLWYRAIPNSHTHTHTHLTHSLSHTHTHTPHSLTLTHTHTHTSLTHSHTHTHTHTHTPLSKVLHSGIVPKPKLWYRAIPNSHTHTHLTHSLTHTHTHTHTHHSPRYYILVSYRSQN